MSTIIHYNAGEITLQDELFPYIKNKLENYLETNWDSLELQNDIELLRKQV